MPPYQFDNVNNYLELSSDTLRIIMDIRENDYYFQYRIETTYHFNNRQLKFNPKLIQVNISRKFASSDFPTEIYSRKLKESITHKYLDEIKDLDLSVKQKIRTVVAENIFFNELGERTVFIADLNRSWDSFDGLVYDKDKRLFYTKFNDKGYFDQQ